MGSLAPLCAQVTERASVSTGGVQSNGQSLLSSSTPDGRYVVFESEASDLVPNDTNGYVDVFVRDRETATTEIVSVSSAGVLGNRDSGTYGLAISADGRYVAFTSLAYNLVPNDGDLIADVFVRDRQSGTTEKVSLSSGGVKGNGPSGTWGVSISADGRFVAFESHASNLVPSDTNDRWDVFVRDRLNGTTERVSVSSAGLQSNADSGTYGVSISADGNFVAFGGGQDLVPGLISPFFQIFVHDRAAGTTEVASVSSSGIPGNEEAYHSSISPDGRFVAFDSSSTNLVAGDTLDYIDAFLHDRQLGTTERVSVSSSGAQGNSHSWSPSVSADGHFVAFHTGATNLVPQGVGGVIVRNRLTGTMELVSVRTDGTPARGGGSSASISPDGRFVAFTSGARNLVPGDSNAKQDIFLHDRDSTGSTVLCSPGLDGVIACPCSNAPSGPARGCDNSASTGGATVEASGIAYLSMDSLFFTTHDELPASASILLQGNALLASGAVYGQGVRCAGGTTKRLFTKTAFGGSILAPDVMLGDPTVSVRSAAKGDVIQPGQSRWYLVYYRDPTVLGGCPSGSTFNSTPTVRIDWSL